MINSFSFLLPVRIDNHDRLNNLKASLNYLNRFFPDCEILLVENDEVKKCADLHLTYPHKYYFISNVKSFCKSETINFGLLKSTRPHFVVWDVDCLIQPYLLHTAHKILSGGKIHIVLPHNELFINIKGSLKQKVSGTLNLDEVPHFKKLPKNINHPDIEVYPIPSGIVAFNKKTLIRIGGYNKKLSSYGWEDIEILKRSKKLGIYYFSFSHGNIIHLDHKRGVDSQVNQQYNINENEFRNIISMSKKELVQYINQELLLIGVNVLDNDFLKSVRKHNLYNFIPVRFFFNRILTKLKTHPLI